MKLKIITLFPALILAIIIFASCTSDPITVTCIGNSITYGSGIEDRVANSYPAQLQEILGEEYEVWNFGYSGRTLLKKGDYPFWNEVHLKAAKAVNPDIVIIKLGTNDTKPQNWQFANDFEGDYKALIQEFINLPSQPKIWLCYPLPVFEERWGIRDSVVVHGIIPVIDVISEDLDLPIIDLYHPFLDKGSMFPDAVHPDKEGAKIMASIIAEIIEDI